ncbi:MAG: hypothetical protein Q7R80_01025 [bacterium]|nr:hypothetical protein [bacterium]MDP3771319.1 hypothetical protein [bacterium]
MSEPRIGEQPGGERPTVNVADRFRVARDQRVRDAMTTADGVHAYRAWRNAEHSDPTARRFRQTFETLADADALRADSDADALRATTREALVRDVVDAQTLPRTEQLRRAIVAAALGPMAIGPPVAPEVARIVEGLAQAKTVEGTVNAIELLTSAGVDFATKAEWFERQILPRLAFLEGRDRDEAQRRMEENAERLEKLQQTGAPPPPDLDVPPPSEDSIQPTMDATEKGGEGRGYFTVSPFFGGYFEEQAFDRWDSVSLRWVRSTSRATQPIEPAPLQVGKERTECGIAIPGRRMDLPLPTGWGVAATANLPEGIRIEEDANGHVVIDATTAEVPAALALTVGPRLASRPDVQPENVPGTFSGSFGAAGEAFLADLARDPALTPIDRTRRCKAFTKRALAYSNDDAMNAVYLGGDPAGYFQRIEEGKKADCDVGNTYCAGLLMRLGIPFELVKGHYVKTKDPKGAASLGSGTRHAWLRVWDADVRAWHRLDATPPGDPTMDDEEMDEREPDDSAFEGDFGEQEADLLTDEELAERQREAEQKERAQRQSPEEQADLAFAEEAGCTPEDARQTRAAIERARNLKDKQGHRIRDRLIQQFSRIVRDNLKETTQYREPVRISEGEELEDPVDLTVDLAAGEPEPSGFGVEERKEVREQVHDGLDLVLVCDKSGSMSSTDSLTGKPRSESQQEVVFLAADALLGVLGDTLRRHRARLIAPLGVRVGVVSFHEGTVTIELPLTETWGPKEQYTLWSKLRRDIGGGTPDHLGMAAAGTVVGAGAGRSTPSRFPSGRKGEKQRDRIRVVLEYSDGESDDPAAFARAVEALREQGIVVGTYRKDLAGFPDFVGEQVIGAVQQLHPKRVRRG